MQIEDTSVSPVTLTVQEALFPLPSAAVAVIFAEPLETAVITPLVTLATLLFELVHSGFYCLRYWDKQLRIEPRTPLLKRKACPVQRYRLNRDRIAYGYGNIVAAAASVGCGGINSCCSGRLCIDVPVCCIYGGNICIAAVPGHAIAVGIDRTNLGRNSVIPISLFYRNAFSDKP